MIKLIIFDVGGVIIHFNDELYKHDITKRFGISYSALSKVIDPLLSEMDVGGASLAQLESAMHKKFGLSKKDLAWNETYQKIARVDYKMISLIRRLSKRYKIAMLTNTCRSRYVYSLNRFIDKDIFHGRFASCYLRMRKPDKQIFDHVISMMGCGPDEALFIDNMKTNINGAVKAGIKGVLFTDQEKLLKDLKRLGIKA
jgi:putative hydrolase of the HAD superfamily